MIMSVSTCNLHLLLCLRHEIALENVSCGGLIRDRLSLNLTKEQVAWDG